MSQLKRGRAGRDYTASAASWAIIRGEMVAGGELPDNMDLRRRAQWVCPCEILMEGAK